MESESVNATADVVRLLLQQRRESLDGTSDVVDAEGEPGFGFGGPREGCRDEEQDDRERKRASHAASFGGREGLTVLMSGVAEDGHGLMG